MYYSILEWVLVVMLTYVRQSYISCCVRVISILFNEVYGNVFCTCQCSVMVSCEERSLLSSVIDSVIQFADT